MMICLLGASLVSCNKDDDDEVKIDYDATYEFEITFTANWFDDYADGVFPEEAGFAPFVAMTHKYKNELYHLGGKASEGLAEYAKTGSTTALETEMSEKITANRSSVYKTGEGNGVGAFDKYIGHKEDVTITFQTTLRHKYLTLVSKINPTPDWFVTVENFDLSSLAAATSSAATVLFIANDAGKKDGTTFENAAGVDTDDVIKRLTSGDITLGGVVPNLGYVTIVNNGKIEED